MLDYKTALALLTHRSGSSSGSSIQSDWNQNDGNEPDFIKNRPGGYDTDSWQDVITDVTVTASEETDAYGRSSMVFSNETQKQSIVNNLSEKAFDAITNEDGVKYLVTWDGEDYECTYTGGASGECYLGGNDYPFNFRYNLYEGYFDAYILDGSETATFTIRFLGKVPVPIPPKYGGMPTLAEDGSDAGKFVKANAAGDGYELTDGYDVVAYENRVDIAASGAPLDTPTLLKATSYADVKKKILAGDLPVALYRRDYPARDESTGEYLEDEFSDSIIQKSNSAVYNKNEDVIRFVFPSLSYFGGSAKDLPDHVLVYRPDGTVKYS